MLGIYKKVLSCSFINYSISIHKFRKVLSVKHSILIILYHVHLLSILVINAK